MSDLLNRRLDELSHAQQDQLLGSSLIGIEKESLRVTPRGRLALTPHPPALGSALTHSYITTDYAEALLEFVTAPESDDEKVLEELRNIHRYVYQHINDELLWNQSMPPILPREADIPIGWYGTSNSGMLRHIYRRGLALRYGKAMQCIAGVHFNFSFSDELWPLLLPDFEVTDERSAQERQSEGYMALIRNFSRYSWLLMYLLGASPALSESFLQGRPHELERMHGDTLYLPWATSLRMSDLGYHNKAQAGLRPCYTNLPAYLDNLYHAVNHPWPAYQALGTRRNGEWQQLSTHILQIENEYYANIRPKRVAQRGERALRALHDRGVEYVEVRCLDIDPFDPIGISLDSTRFLRVFLTFCALEHSPNLPQDGWCEESGNNFAKVVREGRRPDLKLSWHHRPITLPAFADLIWPGLEACARALDRTTLHGGHVAALEAQRKKVDDASLTPSARLLQSLRDSGETFQEFTLAQSRVHAQKLLHEPLPTELEARFVAASIESIEAQRQLESDTSVSFEEYLEAYHASLAD